MVQAIVDAVVTFVRRGIVVALQLLLVSWCVACRPSAAGVLDSYGNVEVRSQDVLGDTENRDVPADAAGDSDTSSASCPLYSPLEGTLWYYGSVGYEIFVRSFYDSNGDGMGDLKGIIEKLDYINDGTPNSGQDLEVDWIWLTPIFESPSYHGYDTTNYYQVDSDYGTNDDLSLLVAEAHKRGLKIVLDLVMNHVSREHPWFQDAITPDASHRDWFVWSDKPLDWTQPWSGTGTWHQQGGSYFYGVFWSGMPDLNWNNPQVKAEMEKVARHWLDTAKVDGYRLDAVRYLVETGPGKGQQDTPETIALWKWFASTIAADFPDVMLVGEAWAANSIAALYHGQGEGLPLTFDFDLMEALVAGAQVADSTDIEGVLCRFPGEFPQGHGDATFLGNHDLMRLFSRLKEDPSLLRLASFLVFTLPGSPMIYYGDELGMPNGALTKDEHKRLPMWWSGQANAGFTTGNPWQNPAAGFESSNVGAQDADPNSLLNFHRGLVRLRKSQVELLRGSFSVVDSSRVGDADVWAFERQVSQDTSVLVIVNLSSEPVGQVKVTGQWKDAIPPIVWPLSANGSGMISNGVLSVGTVPPRSGMVVRVLNNLP